MAHRFSGPQAARLAGALAVGGLVWLSSAGAAGAATPPAPLGGALTTVTDPATSAVTRLLGGAATPALPTPPPGSPALPSLPAPPALPGLPGQDPSGEAQDDPGASAEVRAPADDDVAAVDAAVAEFLGVCARVPQGVVPVRATIVVLDHDVIAELVEAGVPLQPLVVPCPKAVGDPAPSQQSAVPRATGPGSGGPADPRSGLPTSLAFTGTEIAPTLVVAGGLIALGLAFLRKAHLLAVVR